MNLLSLSNISKSYGKFQAINSVSFSIPLQSIFGMLGPNGSGKTTTIRIITNILVADSGEILFNGEKLNGMHTSQMGYMPEERGLYKKMKILEHLIYLARLKGLSNNDAKTKVKLWMEKFSMEDWANKKVEELSKGMQQKIQFIATVIHEPKLIILDEPFSGLDPINSNLIKDEILNLRNNGATIMFSTHRMEQAEEICEEIVLYNKGKIILNGSVRDAKHRFKKNEFQLSFEGNAPQLSDARFPLIEKSEHTMRLKISAGENSNQLLSELLQQKIQITGFNEILPSLNEIFIEQVANN